MKDKFSMLGQLLPEFPSGVHEQSVWILMGEGGVGNVWLRVCLADTGLVLHSPPGAQVLLGGRGGQEINIFSLTAERKGWTGLKSYQKK